MSFKVAWVKATLSFSPAKGRAKVPEASKHIDRPFQYLLPPSDPVLALEGGTNIDVV